MARQTNQLTALKIKNINSPGYYGDGHGLYLQVSSSGTKSWIFRFMYGKKRHEMGLGSIHTISLAQARNEAHANRLLLADYQNPLTVKRSKQPSQSYDTTFDQCAALYIKAHRQSWKNAKHASQWESTLKTYASPIMGHLSVKDVDTSLVIKALEPLWNTKTETATRLRGRIEAILDWATVSQYRQGENPARWKGHLSNLLANPGRSKQVTHFRALPWQEMSVFITQLHQQEGIASKALELLILTACRSGEVRLATWEEFDLEQKIWIIPATRMKAGKEHRIPLSTRVLEILRTIPVLNTVPAYVFPGISTNKALSDMTLIAVLKRMGYHTRTTVHGFRSTFRDWCAESMTNSFPREVCEHALAHSLPDRVEAAYRRGDLLEKRTLLMQTWSEYCYQLKASL